MRPLEIAKNIVAAGLAKKALAQIGYAIGAANPFRSASIRNLPRRTGLKTRS
ncbi:MAG: methionine adenosyltransferase domain-containing protein [Helicobacteraceae bacterium]|nr:methionine adenosyltransferase domain-containing protein [Helicobacteraceae bacterium]